MVISCGQGWPDGRMGCSGANPPPGFLHIGTPQQKGKEHAATICKSERDQGAPPNSFF